MYVLSRLRTWSVIVAVAVVSVVSVVAVAPASAQSSTSSSTSPSCTFNGASFPIVGGLTAGSKVQVDCTGLPALTPFLLFQTSLLIAIDPNTASLLSGSVSPSTLIAVLSALPLINVEAFTFPTSDENGDLDYSYTIPSSQAPDPNASCPPSKEEFNSGLIGCALALVDLENATAVSAGSALLEYKGFDLFPPGPTLAVKPKKATPGETVHVSDAKGATTYWWIATLAKLLGLVGASAPTPTPSVKIQKVGTVTSDATATSASYNGTTFTPPALSGSFTVPSTLSPGKYKVVTSLTADVSGFDLGQSASTPLTVKASSG